MTASLVVGNIFGVTGLIIAARYLLRPGKIPPTLDGSDELYVAFRRLLRRRRITAALMAVAAGLFLLAINLLHGLRDPTWAAICLAIWLVILLLVFVLLVLAFIDLRTLTRIRNELRRRVGQHLDEVFGGR